MAGIKTREHSRDIKVLDKSLVAGERMKSAFIRSKNQAKNLAEDGDSSPTEYAEQRVEYVVSDTVREVGHEAKSKIDQKIEQGRNAYREQKIEAKAEKQAQKVEEALHRYDPDLQHTTYQSQNQTYTRGKGRAIKNAEKSQKTIKQTARTTKDVSIKTAKATTQTAEKGIKTAGHTSKTAIKTAEATAKTAEKKAQATAKATAAMVKAIIAGLKSLVAAIAAGGWVAVAVVVVICAIALVMGSCFGIFFSSEENGSNQTMCEVVHEINEEYQEALEEIKTNNPYDELEMSGSRAVWPEVLSVYAVKMTTDPNANYKRYVLKIGN